MDARSTKNRRPSGQLALGVFGALCLLAGLGGLVVLALTVYGGPPSDHARAMRLGLAGSVLASAVAQVLALIGGWALWRALNQRP